MRACWQSRGRANGLKHQTLPLMGATRLASGKDVAFVHCCCCSAKSKRANELKHQTLPLMGATRPASGKDAAII